MRLVGSAIRCSCRSIGWGLDAAFDHGWGYVDGTYDDAAAHGFCAGGERWVYSPADAVGNHNTSDGGYVTRHNGLLHPNRLGQRNYACHLYLELRARLVGSVASVTGVYAERVDLHMGIVWIKALTLKTGHANVIKHLDPVLEALASGRFDPSPLVTHHMSLDEAPEAYATYDRREALKIVLRP